MIIRVILSIISRISVITVTMTSTSLATQTVLSLIRGTMTAKHAILTVGPAQVVTLSSVSPVMILTISSMREAQSALRHVEMAFFSGTSSVMMETTSIMTAVHTTANTSQASNVFQERRRVRRYALRSVETDDESCMDVMI